MSINPHTITEIGLCPGCGARIRFQNKVQVGEFVICEECGDELEVISKSPIKLDWAFEDPFDEDYEEIDDDVSDVDDDDLVYAEDDEDEWD